MLLTYLLLRFIRRRFTEPPSFFPESLKNKWRAWTPGTYTNPAPTTRLPSTRSARRNQRRNPPLASRGVDRNTSVRSVMTLPAYRELAAEDRERTIGREGERGGMDVVLEFAESQEEEEEHREQHMQTLYEIRLARQLERTIQRESGDLGDLSLAGGRPGSSGSSVRLVPPEPPVSTTALMQALQSITERERRLSKVQYAEIGVARHDGTRVRPSMDSIAERPLLGDAASVGFNGNGSIRSSYQSHGRTGSGVSVGSMGTPERRGSDEIMRMGSNRPSLDTRRSTTGGRPESEQGLLQAPPPAFVDQSAYDGSEWGPPPDYTSPVETRNYGVNNLPVLRIDTGTPSPGVSRAPSPMPLPQFQH
jgi:hypothetical protein